MVLGLVAFFFLAVLLSRKTSDEPKPVLTRFLPVVNADPGLVKRREAGVTVRVKVPFAVQVAEFAAQIGETPAEIRRVFHGARKKLMWWLCFLEETLSAVMTVAPVLQRIPVRDRFEGASPPLRL